MPRPAKKATPESFSVRPGDRFRAVAGGRVWFVIRADKRDAFCVVVQTGLYKTVRLTLLADKTRFRRMRPLDMQRLFMAPNVRCSHCEGRGKIPMRLALRKAPKKGRKKVA